MPIADMDRYAMNQVPKKNGELRMLDFHKNRSIQSYQEHEIQERRIKDMDKKMDRLIYELSGLTNEEIKIVGGDVTLIKAAHETRMRRCLYPKIKT